MRHFLSASEMTALDQRLDTAQRELELEFRGLDAQEIYRLAFSRLLKPDPLSHVATTEVSGRPTMLGADERDKLVPVVREILKQGPDNARIVDLGAGDGQTMSFLLDSVPRNGSFELEEPNPGYLGEYLKVLARRADLSVTATSDLTFDDYVSRSPGEGGPTPAAADIVLSIHMLYFVKDHAAALGHMVDMLKPGGKAVVIVADGVRAFTSRSVQHYLLQTDSTAARQWAEREARLLDIFGIADAEIAEHDCTATVRDALGRDDLRAHVIRQSTRLYGHSLTDMLALGFITGLAEQDDRPVSAQIMSMRRLLQSGFIEVSLAIEGDEPRVNMYSVSEPQLIIELVRH